MKNNTALNIRTSEEKKKLIRKAANMVGSNLSNFLIQSATEKAYRILNEQNNITLNDKQWETFCNQLDKKPKFISALHNLLTKPSAFND